MTLHHSFVLLAAAMVAGTLHAEPAKPVDNTPRLAYGQMLKSGDKVVFIFGAPVGVAGTTNSIRVTVVE